MAIHPRYADAILDGRKQVEFRKRALADDIETVVIYATAPVQKIVGEFRIRSILAAPPRALWAQLHAVGGIDEDSFNDYYDDRQTAFGILVGSARRYAHPLPLSELQPTPAIPQSFAYLPISALHALHQAETGSQTLVRRVLSLLRAATALVPASRTPAEVIPMWQAQTSPEPHHFDARTVSTRY